MSIYKDTKTKTWYVVVRYKNSHGETKQTTKRGFKTKREGVEWEREFLLNVTFNIEMRFKNMAILYLKDLKPRVRQLTYITKETILRNRLLPYFGEMKLCDITPIVVREWQNDMIEKTSERTGRKYKSSYMATANAVLKAIFGFAVNFYNLKENPVAKAGNIKLEDDRKISIWTQEDFYSFIKYMEKRPLRHAGFHTLFFCGLRIGELLALTKEDVDLENYTIRINKSYRRIASNNIVAEPKTKKSYRTIKINKELKKILEEYMEKIYGLEDNHRIFPTTRYTFRDAIIRFHERAGVKKIRVHDLRHSHASLLINLGVNPLAISKRLGHATVEMTLNTYSHLYPSYDEKLMNVLDDIYLEMKTK